MLRTEKKRGGAMPMGHGAHCNIEVSLAARSQDILNGYIAALETVGLRACVQDDAFVPKSLCERPASRSYRTAGCDEACLCFWR